MNTGQKVRAEHLKRAAYLYIRQSSLRQVVENTESAQRQYGLRQRAVGLGWSQDQIVVIDSDQGQSAAPGAADRDGFQELVRDVGMGRAGIVMGLEVSRLARNCADWHRLLEICAVTETLILDEDGLYDPKDFNDRLLLGMKGTMSEAELHIIRARLRGGSLNKARRGELRKRLPVGFVYNEQGKVVLDPDRQVQQAVQLMFATFKREGSAYRTVKTFREQDLKFPKRLHCGEAKGELVWENLTLSRVHQILHNPRYAGAYYYGRTQQCPGADGRLVVKRVPRKQWHALIADAHEGYISWDEYERNERLLQENSREQSKKRKCPPREGPALLQGLAVCGVCGRRMTVRYHKRRGSVSPDYVCNGLQNIQCLPKCQAIPGDGIDRVIGELLLEVVTPVALEVALSVQEELEKRYKETDKLRRQRVERARYEAERARRRYMKVDPDNRLVAGELESQWNEKIRAVQDAEEEYKRQQEMDRLVVDEEIKHKVKALAKDFPRLWRDPKTPYRERKRMARLLIEDVTLKRDSGISVQVRFKGGATRSLQLPRPLSSWEEKMTDPEVVNEIDRLLDDHTFSEIAEVLNDRGRVSGCGKAFDSMRVRRIYCKHALKDRYTRLREAGFLTVEELAVKLGMTRKEIVRKLTDGDLRLVKRKLSDKRDYMYKPPTSLQGQGRK